MKQNCLIIFLLLVSAPKPAAAQFFDVRSGNKAYGDGQYDEAKKSYDKVIAEHPEAAAQKEARFNSGNAMYRKKEFDAAQKSFESIASNAMLDKSIRSAAHYNMGNALYKKSESLNDEEKEAALTETLKHYKESLKLNPADRDAKTNYEFVRNALKKYEDKKQKKDAPEDGKKKEPDKNNQQDQKKQEENKNQNDQQKDKQKEQDKQNQDGQNQDKQNEENKNGENKPQDQPQQGQDGQGQPQQFSQKEAERILNSLKQDEKNTLKKYQIKKATGVKIEKDW